MSWYNNTYMDIIHYEYKRKLSCRIVNVLPKNDFCNYVETTPDCLNKMVFINYVHLMYCKFKIDTAINFYIGLSVLIFAVFLYALMIAAVAESFLVPALKIVARRFKMTEHTAGVTLLAFFNSLGDLFTHLSNKDIRFHFYTSYLASALYIILIVGAVACYVDPMMLDAHRITRDILFFILGICLFEYQIANDGHISYAESVNLILLICIFVTVVLVDAYLLSSSIRNIKHKIRHIHTKRPGKEYEEDELLDQLHKLMRHGTIDLIKRQVWLQSNQPGAHGQAAQRYLAAPHEQPDVINPQFTRTINYHRRRSRNRGLIPQFLRSVIPFSKRAWEHSSFPVKIFSIIRAPFHLVALLTMPRIDAEWDMHGWTKILNCLHVVITPALIVVLIMAHVENEKYNAFLVSFNPMYAVYTLPLTVPAMLLLFLISRTDLPPPCHHWMGILTISASVCWIYVCCAEIDKALYTIGLMMTTPISLMGVSLLVVATCIDDIITNITLSCHGYPQMAFAATIGSPFMTLLLSGGISFLRKSKVATYQFFYVNLGRYALNIYTYLLLILAMTLVWTSVLNYYSRRCVGIFYFIVIILLVINLTLIELEVISPFKTVGPRVHQLQ